MVYRNSIAKDNKTSFKDRWRDTPLLPLFRLAKIILCPIMYLVFTVLWFASPVIGLAEQAFGYIRYGNRFTTFVRVSEYCSTRIPTSVNYIFSIPFSYWNFGEIKK